MNPAKYDINIYKGATFQLRLTHRSNGNPTNLLGYTAMMRMKRDDRTVTAPDAFFKADTSNGSITVNEIGEVYVLVSATDTAQITSVGEGIWGIDLMAPDGTVIPILRGIAVVKPSVMV
jgi:hypothetical protein